MVIVFRKCKICKEKLSASGYAIDSELYFHIRDKHRSEFKQIKMFEHQVKRLSDCVYNKYGVFLVV